MGARGPVKTPLSLLEMRGSTLCEGRSEIPHVAGMCDCPEWLGEHGQAKWNQMLPLLSAVPGLIKPAYADALAIYCEAYEEFRAAKDAIAGDGATATAQSGAIYQHPEVGRKNRAIQRMRQWGALFGLSPSDATRVNPGDKGSPSVSDPMAEFLEPGVN